MAFVMLVGLLPTFAKAGEEEYIYLYPEDKPYLQMSMYPYKKIAGSQESYATVVYRLQNTQEEGEILYAYCADANIADSPGVRLKSIAMSQYGDASSNIRKNSDHLRAIINNSYPFITIDEMVGKMNNAGIYTLNADTVPYYDMAIISAVQQTIYAYTNPEYTIQDPYPGAFPPNIYEEYKEYIFAPSGYNNDGEKLTKNYHKTRGDIITIIKWLKSLTEGAPSQVVSQDEIDQIAQAVTGEIIWKNDQYYLELTEMEDGYTWSIAIDGVEYTVKPIGGAASILLGSADKWAGKDTIDIKITAAKELEDVVIYEAETQSQDVQPFIGQGSYLMQGFSTINAPIPKIIRIVPADITIYMGGDEGYEAVVGNGSAIGSTDSLPTPLFYIEAPTGVAQDKLVFTSTETVQVGEEQKNKQWKVSKAGEDADGNDLFYINKAYEIQDDVRVQYVNEATGEAILNDTFDPMLVQNLFEDYTIELYTNTQSYDQITATAVSAPQVQYKITAETGTLRVRAVEDTDNGKNPVSIVVNKAPETKLNSNTAAVFAPAGTGYTLNHTTVSVEPSGVGLLFDDIYDSDHETDSREAALIAGTDTVLGEVASGTTRYYQAKYLDLVDTKNGNAWVKTTNNQEVTVYWAYPDGTDQNTSFTLLHFANLHRDTADGASSGYTTDDIYKVTPDTVTIERTGAGIRFDVPSGGFSPFVLVWEIRSGGGTTGGGGGGSSTGKLNISKQVTNGDRDKAFTFQVELTNSAGKALTGKYSYSGSKSGTLQSGDSVKLAHGESITISGIPSGTKYKVTEVEANRNGYVTTAENDAGTISSSATARAAFTNRMNPEDLSTEDHYGYIIGYPMDYRTGEPTRDQALWPIQPANNITRAEVATIFFRLLSDQARETYWKQTNNYSDVDIDQWFNNAISTLSNMELINGYPDGTFRPDAYITRAEFAKIAAGFFDYATSYQQGTYVDVDANAWYADYIAAAVDLGLINGYPDGTIRPDVGIIRAEACTIVNRTLGRAPDKDYLLPTSEMRVWPDNSDTSVWYYAHMQEATNSHDYDWADAGNDRIETWTAKLPDRDWEALEKEWSNANSAPGGEVMN